MKARSQVVSEPVIDPGLDDVLDGIDEFSHLMVLYWAHRSPASKRSVTRVHPLASKDFPLVGVISTHSPARPNSILVTIVRFISREGNVLKVAGLDAIEGSHYDAKDVRMPDRMRRMHRVFREDKPLNCIY
jgi:tRNA (adenine37-N6)-methyltransferase